MNARQAHKVWLRSLRTGNSQTPLERIETGITHVNSPTVGGEAQLPFGGYTTEDRNTYARLRRRGRS